ncbi:MAG: peroxiredoxin [Methylobacteriaceae bacterium]|nr:peroxiredoxin [Methylobacteriaceae bacterium]
MENAAAASNFLTLPSDLPVPVDDGGAAHLSGMRLPSVRLPATDGSSLDLGALPGLSVLYFYPRTGRPGEPLPEGWDAIPGARGCTPQSCAFRDHFAEFQALGVAHVFGISTQDTAYQKEVAVRLHLPFRLLSDADFELTRTLSLPTFVTSGMTLLKRLTIIARDSVIETVFYPVFPPDRNAADVIAALRARS